MFFFIHTVKYILTVLYLHAALFLQFLLYYSNEVRWTILFNSGILYIFNTQLLGCSFTFCFLFPSCFCSWGNQSVAAFKTSLKGHANFCSLKELYWESRLWSKLVAEIHFNAFLLTRSVKIKPRSSVDITWPPSPACKLWTSRKNLSVIFPSVALLGSVSFPV